MSVTYTAKPVEFGEAITPGTGTTTISGLDYGVALSVEKTTELEDGTTERQAVVLTMSLVEAAALAKDLSDAAAVGRFKQFMAKVRGQK